MVKCQDLERNEIVAGKVVKTKPAYFYQSMIKITILELVRQDMAVPSRSKYVSTSLIHTM